MKKVLGALALLSVLLACDDGDVITSELIFSGDLDRCDSFVDEYLIYDLNTDPFEALNFIIPRNDVVDSLFVHEISEEFPFVFDLSSSEIPSRFLYRTYSAQPDLCAIIEDGGVVITSDFEATSGQVEMSNTLLEFDDDGIPTEVEDLNEDGDFDPSTNPTDTDGDGIPDYLDQDDDNDNVLTKDEDDNDDGDNDPSTNPRDTDGDGTPDYLDKDDDGDGVDTRLEDANGNQNLFDDFDLESENPNLPRFLNKPADVTYEDTEDINNVYTQQFTAKFVAVEIDLTVISYERATFGTYVTEISISNSEQ